MRQIPEDELRFVLKFVLQQLPQAARKALSSHDSDIRRRALDVAASALVTRMAKWEILVPEPLTPPANPPNWRGDL